MIRVVVPQELRGSPAHEDEMAQGPFVVEHAGERVFAAHLERFDHGWQFVTASGMEFPLSNQFKATAVIDELHFKDDIRGWEVTIRPVTLEDAEWAFPEDDEYTDLDDLKQAMLRTVNSSM